MDHTKPRKREEDILITINGVFNFAALHIYSMPI